jgi:CBS domain-containing protein
VRDVMKPEVVTVVPEMTVGELVQTFLEEHVRGAPVLGPTGKVIGIVSESDVLRLMLRCGGCNPRNGPGRLDEIRVGEIMGPVDSVFAPGDPLALVAQAFARDHLQRAVVIEDDYLLGIVTPADLIPAVDWKG